MNSVEKWYLRFVQLLIFHSWWLQTCYMLYGQDHLEFGIRKLTRIFSKCLTAEITNQLQFGISKGTSTNQRWHLRLLDPGSMRFHEYHGRTLRFSVTPASCRFQMAWAAGFSTVVAADKKWKGAVAGHCFIIETIGAG